MKTAFWACLFVVILHISPLAQQNASQATSHSDNASNRKVATPPATPTGAAPECKESAKENQLSTNNDDKWAARWGVYINAALALATFVLAMYAVKQASAAKVSADAAKLSAQAIINSERPWIFIKHNTGPAQYVQPRNTHVQILGHNKGRTPAEISVITASFDWIDVGWVYPAEPKYPNEQLIYKKYVAPDEEPFDVYAFDCSTVVTDEMWVEFKGKRLTFTGHIVYKDLISGDKHETRFCYFLSPAPGVGLVMTGPPSYNEHT